MEMLGIYESGSEVSVEFSINVLSPISATYSLFGSNGTPIATDIAVPIRNDNLVSFEIQPSYNTLLPDVEKDTRRIELITTGESGEKYIDKAIYLLRSNLELTVPQQSFISIDDATLLAFDLHGCESFVSLDNTTKRQLLLKATKKLKRLNFSYQKIMGWYLNGTEYYPQDRLDPNTAPNFLSVGDRIDFDEIKQTDFLKLPERFLRDLSEACVQEATSINDVNEIQQAREYGITSETIGEVSLTLKSGIVKVNEYGSETMKILSRYLRNNGIVRRT